MDETSLYVKQDPAGCWNGNSGTRRFSYCGFNGFRAHRETHMEIQPIPGCPNGTAEHLELRLMRRQTQL